jgi:hypothetical protein
MKHFTPDEKENQAQAKALLADIQGSPAVALPRRETIVDWLEAYLRRSDRRGYVMDDSEGTDLHALARFLRAHGIALSPAA